ncbi:guanine nucleotide-binding protein subunit alpha [Cladophialophora chaetospira]|uniref:Guanine nucleotide-binding protein subunit alpha n=1 Tax=Cladophialophora chaetospira TaxID=386627 RepID=A0AA38X6B5_9EURO|nr:guanine nucleotide-binding protein subunit alpha [Cladophialophora chaetospira]
MGCKPSKEEYVYDEGQVENDHIEKQLRHDEVARSNEIKILLLGTGDSGKSTVLKQLKFINGPGYSEDDRTFFKGIIFTNIVHSMLAILEAMDAFGIPFASPTTANPHASVIFAQPRRPIIQSLPCDVSLAISTLWDDAGVRACFSRCSEFQICDSAQYYFDEIERIASEKFIPTDQDILRSRQKTTGVAEFSFTNKATVYRIIDVGGQRSERKKWMHYFEDVDLVLFLVAMSEYDQALYEDGSVNRLQEALDLFSSICQSQWFKRTAVQLVFNKTDIFRQKLKHSPLQAHFPDFHGGSDYAAAREYISNKFISMAQMRYPDNYICATDTSQVRLMLGRIMDRL